MKATQSKGVSRRKLMEGIAVVAVTAATAKAIPQKKKLRVTHLKPQLTTLACPGTTPVMKKDDSNVHRFIAAFLFLVTNRKLAVELGGVGGGHPNAISTDEIAKKLGFNNADEVRSIWCVAKGREDSFDDVAQAFYDLAQAGSYDPGEPGCPSSAEALTKVASLATS